MHSKYSSVMLKKFILVLMPVFFAPALFSQDLSEKMKQLQELNEQISKEQLLIEEKEALREQKEEDLQSTRKRKLQADQEEKKLKKSEQDTKKKLDLTIGELSETEASLKNLYDLCEHEVNQLVLAHIRSQMYPNKQLDSRFLASVIQKTTDYIELAAVKKKDLEQDKLSTNSEYENLIWKRINTKKKIGQYSNQISDLQTNIAQIEREKAKSQLKKKQLEQEAAQLNELISKLQSDILTEEFSYKFSTDKLIWPVKGEIIRGFGEHHSSEYKVSLMNNGIDIKVTEGTPIVAVEDGIVAFAEWYTGAGKLVIIDHRNGYFSLYSHNNTLLVSKGDNVIKSQQIALSGKTGSVQVPSLHFELRRRGKPVNPLDYLE